MLRKLPSADAGIRLWDALGSVYKSDAQLAVASSDWQILSFDVSDWTGLRRFGLIADCGANTGAGVEVGFIALSGFDGGRLERDLSAHVAREVEDVRRKSTGKAAPAQGLAVGPAVTRAVVVDDDVYVHVPDIAGFLQDGAVHEVIACTRNPASQEESAAGQVVSLLTRVDDGAWSAPFQPHESASYTTNPFGSSPPLQGESFITIAGGVELFVFSHQEGERSTCIAARAASADREGDKATIHRLVWDTASGAPVFRADSLTGSAPSGHTIARTLRGTPNMRPVFTKPYACENGDVIVPMMHLDIWQDNHMVSLLRISDLQADLTAVTLEESALIPLGDVGAGGAWECFYVETLDGGATLVMRDLSAADELDRVVRSYSADGFTGWSAFRAEEEDLHGVRNMPVRLADRLWMGARVVHRENRNCLEGYWSSDGQGWCYGLTLSDEVDGQAGEDPEFVHYSSCTVLDGKVRGVYTSGPASPVEVLKLTYFSFALPASPRTMLLPSSKAAYQENDPTLVSSIAAGNLSIPPGTDAGILPQGSTGVLQAGFSFSAPPGSGAPYPVLVIGTGAEAVELEYRSDNKLWLAGRDTGLTWPVYGDVNPLTVGYDWANGRVYVGNAVAQVPRGSQIRTGDAFADVGGSERPDAPGTMVVHTAATSSISCAPEQLSLTSGRSAGEAWRSLLERLTATDLVRWGDIDPVTGAFTPQATLQLISNVLHLIGSNKFVFRDGAGSGAGALAYMEGQDEAGDRLFRLGKLFNSDYHLYADIDEATGELVVRTNSVERARIGLSGVDTVSRYKLAGVTVIDDGGVYDPVSEAKYPPPAFLRPAPEEVTAVNEGDPARDRITITRHLVVIDNTAGPVSIDEVVLNGNFEPYDRIRFHIKATRDAGDDIPGLVTFVHAAANGNMFLGGNRVLNTVSDTLELFVLANGTQLARAGFEDN